MSQAEFPKEVRKALIGANQLVNQAKARLLPHQEIIPCKEIVQDLKEIGKAIDNLLTFREEPKDSLGPDEGIKSKERFGQDGAILTEQP